MKKLLYFIISVLLLGCILSSCSSEPKLTKEEFCIYDGKGNMVADVDKTDDGTCFLYSEVTDADHCTKRGVKIGSSLAEVVAAYSGFTANEIVLSGADEFEKYDDQKIDILNGDAREIAEDVSVLICSSEGYALRISVENGDVSFITTYTPEAYRAEIAEREASLRESLGDEMYDRLYGEESK